MCYLLYDEDKFMINKYLHYSDEELFENLDGVSDESKLAFTEIYNRYSRRVFAYCLKVLGDKEKAEDVFQEVFVRFYKNAPRYTFTSINSLLISFARNLCLNIKRDTKIFVDISSVLDAYKTYQDTDKEEMIKLVSIALDTLDDEYKEPLVLKVYNGLRYEEISELCGISIGAARTRVFRAKDKLKEALQPYLQEIYDYR